MNYEQYKMEMDKLQKQFDYYASIDNFAGMDVVQQKMDNLTASVCAIADANLRRLTRW
jgi:hypothetical protein